jgi:uncharacterized protein (TIGR02145 family)
MKIRILLSLVLVAIIFNSCTKEEEEGKAPIAVFKTEVREAQIYEEVLFEDASSNEPSEWSWDFGDGNISSEQNPKHVYKDTGIYTVSLFAKNEFGEDSYEKKDGITIIEIPPPGFSASREIIKVGETVSFIDTSDFEGLEWNWDFGDGSVSDEKNPSHTFATEGLHNITLEIKHANGSIVNQKKEYVKVYENIIEDIDNNRYGVVVIGSQNWLAQNLQTTKLNNGEEILFISPTSSWVESTSPSYCWYNVSNEKTADSTFYGALYNYYTVETEMVCPDGWHVPTKRDWRTLESFLASKNYEDIEGKALKTTSGWIDNNGDDIYKFSALPAGYRDG